MYKRIPQHCKPETKAMVFIGQSYKVAVASHAAVSCLPRSRICLLMDRLRAKFGQVLCSIAAGVDAQADGGPVKMDGPVDWLICDHQNVSDVFQTWF